MGHDQLENLVRIGQLKRETPSSQEIDGLILSGNRRLSDSKNESLSFESRFDLAYNAAHALSLAALRRTGYRSASRYLVFQCLKHTLQLEDVQWRVLDRAHQKRNLAEYEGHLDLDEQLLDALIRATDLVSSLLSQFAGDWRTPNDE